MASHTLVNQMNMESWIALILMNVIVVTARAVRMQDASTNPVDFGVNVCLVSMEMGKEASSKASCQISFHIFLFLDRYQCDPLVHRPQRPPSPPPRHYESEEYPDETAHRPNEHLYPDETEQRCQSCSPNAACVNGQCRCNFGYNGDGTKCQYNCHNDLVWNGNTCEQLSQPEECKFELNLIIPTFT